MKHVALLAVEKFLTQFLQEDEVVVLGFSGGGDSSALLSLLIECRKSRSFSLHVAHFDHGWREESKAEALLLEAKIRHEGLAFHCQRAESVVDKNIEAVARESRYAFFAQVYEKVGARALILAHQQEDQEETILKRILEGAGITALVGMKPISYFGAMQVWRPLLGIPKQSLRDWNRKRSVSYLEDRTNRDEKFLRARMRISLFPFIESCFGKNIRKNLLALAEEMGEMVSEREPKVLSLLHTQKKGMLADSLFLGGEEDHSIRREVLKRFLGERGAVLSRESLQTACLFLRSKEPEEKTFDVGHGLCWVCRGRVFWRKEPVREECWDIVSGTGSLLPLWESLLQGEIPICVPKGESIQLLSLQQLSAKQHKKARAFLVKKAIPSRFRSFFPVIVNKSEEVVFYYLEQSADCLCDNSVFCCLKLRKNLI